MKVALKLSGALIFGLFATLIHSCKDKTDPISEPDEIKNELVVDGVSHALAHGEILRIEKIVDGKYYAPIYILSDGFTLTDVSVSGTGHAMELKVITDQSSHIRAGEYSFDPTLDTAQDVSPGTFIAGVFMDWHLATFAVSGFYKGKSGNLKIIYENGTYTFDITIIADLYDIGHAGIPPSGTPIKTDVQLKLTFKGDMRQKYFS